MELHPAVAHLAPLLGNWRGGGRGDYPTIEAFEYTEEVRVAHVGKPFLAYSQLTKSPEGAPLHAETGYMRPAGERGLEVLLTHPSGIAEMLVGEVTETHYGLLLIMRAGARAKDREGGEAAAADGAGTDSTGAIDTASSPDPDGRTDIGVRVGDAGRVILTPSAKQVDATERRISVDGDTLRYEVHMAAVGEPMGLHLEATLQRAD